ncbi:MAG: hypothetical protein AAF283_03275 [Cyanobacteria bacterium P01_A01_bin.70]
MKILAMSILEYNRSKPLQQKNIFIFMGCFDKVFSEVYQKPNEYFYWSLIKENLLLKSTQIHQRPRVFRNINASHKKPAHIEKHKSSNKITCNNRNQNFASEASDGDGLNALTHCQLPDSREFSLSAAS